MEVTNSEALAKITAYHEVRKCKGIVVPFATINKANKLLREKGLATSIPK